MTSLTTRQRDLLQHLLDNKSPVIVSDLAQQCELSPRQVTYSLKGVRTWLRARDVALKITPGVGIELLLSRNEKKSLKQALSSQPNFQLVLSMGQRQQLFALNLLTSKDPLILYNLQQLGQVSRTTILKDLEMVGEWLISFGLNLERRPNYGIWISGPERNIRQALAALLWGDTPFEDGLWHMTHRHGLIFVLQHDSHLLPTLEEVHHLVTQLKTKAMMQLVATAEANLGGRFTDNAVLQLALTFAIQTYRLNHGQTVNLDHISDNWLEEHPVWGVAQKLLDELKVDIEPAVLQAETGMIAMQLLACAKNDRFAGDIDSDGRFPNLIALMMKTIGEAYELPELENDATLRDGLIANVLPACLRKHFRVWAPQLTQSGALSADRHGFEKQLARHLAEEISQEMGIQLSPNDLENLAFLLRAAYIRKRPHRLREVIVVCPSGMATAQLLLARLKARFPRLGNLTVVSVRELNPERLLDTDLIISTVPLIAIETAVEVIQVHPQLLPEDVTRITQWLA